MRWKTVEYSRKEIDRAGHEIKSGNTSKEVMAVIDNWRASHAYPLQVFYCNLKEKAGEEMIVAQRLKRLSSIVAKLQREPKMDLWSMQDLGGCRVVVPTLEDVYTLVNRYKKSRVRHILKKENDYIGEPRSSGYRSYHLIYKFQSDKK